MSLVLYFGLLILISHAVVLISAGTRGRRNSDVEILQPQLRNPPDRNATQCDADDTNICHTCCPEDEADPCRKSDKPTPGYLFCKCPKTVLKDDQRCTEVKDSPKPSNDSQTCFDKCKKVKQVDTTLTEALKPFLCQRGTGKICTCSKIGPASEETSQGVVSGLLGSLLQAVPIAGPILADILGAVLGIVKALIGIICTIL